MYLVKFVRELFQPTPAYKVTYVEGNVASGKSTVLAQLKAKHPDVAVATENVSQFSLLASRYRNPSRFFFSSQVQICMVHHQTILDALQSVAPGSHVIIERSLHSSLVFAQMALSHNHITRDEYALLEHIVNLLHTNLAETFKLEERRVYIQCDPTACFEYAQKRARASEAKLTQAELSQLHQLHDVFCSAAIKVVNDVNGNTESLVDTIANF